MKPHDELAVRAAIQAYLDAWNSGDAERLAALCASDCNRIGAVGQRFDGKAAILNHYPTVFATPTPVQVRRTLGYEISSVRFISNRVAIVDAKYRVVGVGPMPDQPADGLNTVVLVKENGHWLRATHRNWIPGVPTVWMRNTQEARNKEVVLRFYNELLVECKPELLDELVAEDYQGHGVRGQVTRCRDAFKDVLERFRRAFPDGKVTVQAIIAEGDLVTVRTV